MVGFRVFDVGLLIVWLVWFFRLRDDDDASGDDGPGGGGPGPPPHKGPDGGGDGIPLGSMRQGRWRTRDHSRTGGGRPRHRGPAPLPGTVPAHVRRPRTPVPAHRRLTS